MLWNLEDTIQDLRSHDLVNTMIISDSEILYSILQYQMDQVPPKAKSWEFWSAG